MKYTISFSKQLPFQPDERQVIYLGTDDDRTSRIVRANYEFLKRKFALYGLEYVDLSMLSADAEVERKVRYYAPYLQAQVVESKDLVAEHLLPYLLDPSKEPIKPSFIYHGRMEGDVWVFDAISLDLEGQGIGFMRPIIGAIADDLHPHAFEEIISYQLHPNEITDDDYDDSVSSSASADIPLLEMDFGSCASISLDKMDREERRPRSEKRPKRASSWLDKFRKPAKEALEDGVECREPEPYEESAQDIAEILSDLQASVARLRLRGVTLMAIHELIDKQEPLSHLVITSDNRLLLPDYNNMEIEMGTLPKALFFLFLRYPEGIVFKTLPDHYTELLNIYRELRPNANEERLRVTITKVTNPLGNAINENVARIRKAFVEKFDEHLAQNYIVRGERGGCYGISLDRNLVVWEE